MNARYTNERNTLMLIALMKAHHIKKVVASPGSTNISLVASLQEDPYFEMYSCVDERSAAYIACGMAAESGEPVALTCTGATASRNYAPGLTEAFYRKLPVLAVTSTMHVGRVGQNLPQVIDRSRPMADIARCSVLIPSIHDAEDEWACNVSLNKALLELRRHGGGPVHVDLVTQYDPHFETESLPEERVIRRIGPADPVPALPKGRTAVFVGSHKPWSEELTRLVGRFCEQHDAVVICDHTSNYRGSCAVYPSLLTSQDFWDSPLKQIDFLIDLGEVSGAYMDIRPREVWRVSPDGEVRDTFRKLTHVFEMEEGAFFRLFVSEEGHAPDVRQYEAWQEELRDLREKIPELPFSNIWIAQQTIHRLPEGSRLHLGILNSLRSWDFFEKNPDIQTFCNTGGFGIDGNVSSLAGAALASPERLFFGVVGDLAFFYDMNILGNRHIGPNIRLLLINNGKGTEFRNYSHIEIRFGAAADHFIAALDHFIAAADHFGSKSPDLAKHYAQDLGFRYLSASTKDEFRDCLETFLSPEGADRPILLEAFTDSNLESDALKAMRRLEVSKKKEAVQTAKSAVKSILGEKGTAALRKIIHP